MKYTNWKEEKFNYNARLYFMNEYEYSHIYMDFFYITESGEKTFAHDLSSFQVSCQIDKESIQRDYNPCYAIRFEYKDSVNVDNYKEVSNILKIVEKGLKNYREKFGYIESMGEYLTVICNIIGIDNIEYNTSFWKPGEIKGFISNYLTHKKEDWNYKNR